MADSAKSDRRAPGFFRRWADDFRANRSAAILDLVGAALTIFATLFLAATAGSTPMLVVFPIWVVSSGTICIAAWLRGNGSMTMQMAINVCFNAYGLVHLLRASV